MVETLWGHDSRGTRVLDALAPDAAGSAISGVAFAGNVLGWTDSGTQHQATLGWSRTGGAEPPLGGK